MSTQDPRFKSHHYLVLGLIAAATIGFLITVQYDEAGEKGAFVSPTLWEIPVIWINDDSYYDLATLLYMSGSLITAIAAFIVAKKYIGSVMFTKAYFCLGLGFCCWFIGDNLFFYDDYVEPLTSFYVIISCETCENGTFQIKPADFVYLGIYPNMALHIYLNTNYFEKIKLKIKKKSIETKFFLFGVPAIGAVIFFLQYGEINPESVFGSLNAVGASVTLGLVFWGARVFRASALAPAWILLLIGIFFSTVGDFLYYQVESFNDEYEIYSLSTTFYLLTYMILTYGLYRHTKII